MPEPAAQLRVVLVDDNALFRSMIRATLETSAAIQVVGEAANGEAALSLVAELAPDAVLLDLEMPRMDGVAAANSLLTKHPDVKIVLLTNWSTGVRARSLEPRVSAVLGKAALDPRELQSRLLAA